jgi:hypothetical protein
MSLNIVAFVLGGLLCIGGIIAFGAEYRVCRRIVRLTAGRGDGLTPTEAWLNTEHFRKRLKLKNYLRNSLEPELQSEARLALRLEAVFYTLTLCGGAIMAASALFQT